MERTQQEYKKLVEESTLYRVITGSTSYGLTVGTSDVDEKGIFQLPFEVYATLGNEFETLDLHEPSDLEMHSLKKFVNLLKKQNPTVSEMIWTPEKNIIIQTKSSQLLRDNRSLFISSNVYHSFGGYAKRQLMRIKGGLNRLTNNDKQVHLEDTLNNMIRTFDDKYSDARSGSLSVNHVVFVDDSPRNVNVSAHFDSIHIKQLDAMLTELHHAMKSYNKMGNRNHKQGNKLYKHAMHLIRLILVGTELLETGNLRVDCSPWKTLLLDIRNEKYTWDEIFEMIDTYNSKLDHAYKHTSLPPMVDNDKIEELYTDMMIDLYNFKR